MLTGVLTGDVYARVTAARLAGWKHPPQTVAEKAKDWLEEQM